ncbi:MFS transporter [Catenisphaera adipataccumulans]|jgi:nitrate/nitrite transporter NarK|uniref:Nitrate/nitrite transporter NarK n=1 Tax=Catenisphaera adipataccumulans TaxID=700500 RepID=A0A7W8D0R6_9FIRM|nr:MFS transporter [Catenisphaera adipataccumulans]MBB5183874.1 nitrate/nitrite transporter NarK [Catenisphaera adipataccumulans]
MKKFMAKLGFGEKMTRNFWAIIIVAFGGAIIYGLPYFRFDYYDVYLSTYHLTNTQMGWFGSILGVFGMISYLFGGVVADRFSTRMILTLSLIGTGLGGFVHLLPLNFIQLCCLYAFWGVSSLFAFWPACVKAVRILSGSGDQGKAFGFFEGGRGIAAALMAMGAVAAFRVGIGSMNDEARGMRYVIIFYSVLTIAMGIAAFLLVHDDDNITSSDRVTFKGIGKVIKMPAVWIISFVTFCNYVFTLSLYYFTPYATGILGASVTFAATLAALKRWFSLAGNIGGGFVTDKFGTGNALLVSFLVMALGTGAILMLPQNKGSIAAFTVLFIIIYVFYNVNYAQTWAMMDEGSLPEEYAGTAAGIISTIGYLPEIFVSLIAGVLVDNNPGYDGYLKFFGFLIVMLLLGAVFVVVWKRYLKKHVVQQG